MIYEAPHLLVFLLQLIIFVMKPPHEVSFSKASLTFCYRIKRFFVAVDQGLKNLLKNSNRLLIQDE